MTPVTEAPLAVRLTERINRIEPSATVADSLQRRANCAANDIPIQHAALKISPF